MIHQPSRESRERIFPDLAGHGNLEKPQSNRLNKNKLSPVELRALPLSPSHVTDFSLSAVHCLLNVVMFLIWMVIPVSRNRDCTVNPKSNRNASQPLWAEVTVHIWGQSLTYNSYLLHRKTSRKIGFSIKVYIQFVNFVTYYMLCNYIIKQT